MSDPKSNLLTELTTQEAAAVKGGKHGEGYEYEYEYEYKKPEKAYYPKKPYYYY